MRDLLNKCLEEMVAHSKRMIKEMLHEALDHKIVREKTNELGHKYFVMRYSNEILEKIANEEVEDCFEITET